MANACFYSVVAVSKKKESLKRLVRIMSLDDPEYYIYRVREVDGQEIEEEGGLFSICIYGDVAWSADLWVNDVPHPDRNDPYYKDNDIEDPRSYVNLPFLCKLLDIGVEVYTEEDGIGFQEHYLVDHNGNIVENESRDWDGFHTDEDYEEYAKENAEEDGEEVPERDGKMVGFGDSYCDFRPANEIYG